MIKIVRGVYGFMDKDGIVRPKTEADEPFELLPEQEARLVDRGVAEYVGDAKIEQDVEAEQVENEGEQAPIGFDETPPEDFVEDEAEVVEEIIDLETLTGKELRELGKEYGLTFKANAKKADMIEAITEAQKEVAVAEDDGELAPVFDASEAVL
jgi:hypothetical protein